MRRILLVEPDYRNKYPPLGLMKISSYHKMAGDEVHFVKGCKKSFKEQIWDRIYISTLFTFFWSKTVKTVKYYSSSVSNFKDVFLGGVMATLMKEELIRDTGVTIISGLLDKPGILDSDSQAIVDTLIPDYKMLDTIEYRYPVDDSFIAYATRGCPNKCKFCAVNKIEPEFRSYYSVKRQVKAVEHIHGEKQNLILLDNNVLASKDFPKIIDDICKLGFERGAKLNGKQRKVDFNQGIDARLLNSEKMELLAKIAIKPLRIAFDDIAMKDTYVSSIRLAAKHGIFNLSNYILYNYTDTPQDFYERLLINCELNLELGTKIYSFPMKYIPLTARDRSYIGKHWHRKLIRGVQCILLATRGMVSPKLDFFEAAFGRTSKEFGEITLMPENYIIYRRKNENDGAAKWKKVFKELSVEEKAKLIQILGVGKITNEVIEGTSGGLKNILKHYL